MSDFSETKPFLKAIEQLLETNKLVLYGRIDEVPTEEMQAVLELLQERFKQEASGYPGAMPHWDPAAASWAVKVLFHAAQLLLYRSHEAEALVHYFPNFGHPQTAAAIISADGCLRYLPGILRHLEAIDVEDELIPILKELLQEWHYSGLLADSPEEPADLTSVLGDECLARLYVDRIIETKNKAMAAQPELRGLVLAALGNHEKTYWNALKLTL
jgi:hypothetical protein